MSETPAQCSIKVMILFPSFPLGDRNPLAPVLPVQLLGLRGIIWGAKQRDAARGSGCTL